ncbi:MAG: type I DNA topoisomerase, partial [Alphaproteobacteria bacterium]|nr:type I DNA topoisomerase [Alphaproteobacteria bacterium]
VQFDGKKVEQFSFTNETAALAVEKGISEAARATPGAGAEGALKVAKIQRKQRRRRPAAPFTTSTLQQEASRKLGFTAKRTMSVAQRLYEGIDTGEGEVGLISYMRTDSVTLANDALAEIRDVILERFGKDNLPGEPRVYKTKAKNAQEAHEAIRPTSAARTPESLRGKLDRDQARLYELIWKRTVACQMTNALYNTVSVDLAAGPHSLRANGSTLIEPGFLAVYKESLDDSKDDDQDRILPPLEEGELVPLLAVRPEQHFTEPPPRYTEASLVKELEEFGIGRPSTYATIISTLQNREYVEMDRKRFMPTDVGRIVNRFLTDHFTRYVDYDFTARLEDSLDAVSRGEEDWVPLMQRFWGEFDQLVQEKETSVSRDDVIQARELGTDPKSGKPVSVRMGRFGPFVQIGTRDDEDKLKFAGLRPGQKIDTITFEDALELFRLPRKLGSTPEGEAVSVNVGRYGPYVRYGDKFVSIREDDPYTIPLSRALELIAEKKEADANRLILDFAAEGIQVLRGRYGPYITDGDRNARVPKDAEPEKLTLATCQELLAKAPPRGRGKKGAKKKTATKKKAAKKKVTKKKATKKAGTKKKAAKKKTTKKPAKKAGGKKIGKKTAARGTTEKTTAAPLRAAAARKKAASRKKTAKKSAGGKDAGGQDGG